MSYFGSLNELTEKEILIQSRIKAELVRAEENSVTIFFPQQDVDVKNAVGFAILDDRNRYVWYSPCEIKEDTFTLTFADFDYLAINKVPLRFKLYLVFEYDNTLTFSRLYSKSVKDEYSATENRKILYNKAVSNSVYRGEKVCLITSMTVSGYFGFILINEDSRVDYLVNNVITKFKLVHGYYFIDVKMDKIVGADSFGLTFRSVRDDKCYDFSPSAVQDMGDYYVLKCRLPRNFLRLDKPDVVNLTSYYEVKNHRYPATVRALSSDLISEIVKLSAEENSEKHKPLDSFTFTVVNDKRLQFSSVLPYNSVEVTDESTPSKILYSADFLANRVMYGEHSVDDKKNYKITMFADMREVSDLSVFVHSTSRKEKIVLDVKDFNPGTGEIIVDFSAMRDSLEDFTPRTYSICVAFSYRGYMYTARVKSPYYTDKTVRKKKFLQNVASYNIKESVVVLQPLYSSKGIFNLKIRERLTSRREKVTVAYNSIYFNDKYLYVVTDITNNKENFTGYALSYRYSLSEDRRIYFAKADLVASGDDTHLKARFDLSKIELQRVYWDIYAVYVEEDVSYFANISVTPQQLNNYILSLRNIFGNNYYVLPTAEGKPEVFFPYFTEEKNVAFMMRELCGYDSTKFKLRELIATAIYKVTRPFLNRKNIILIYEKGCQSAHDNGYHLFKYCMKHKAERRLGAKIYYIIDPKSPEYKNVAKYKDNLIEYMSMKHLVYLIASKLLVSSEGRNDCYILNSNNSVIARFLCEKKFAFLQRGVMGLKNVNKQYKKNRGDHPDLFIASSRAEKKIITENLGFDDNEVCVTGLARWDDLNDTSHKYNEILIVPTFRDWLCQKSENDFKESEFFKKYSELLNSPKLHSILEEYDLTLNFSLHPVFSRYKNLFTSDCKRVNIIKAGDGFNDYVMRAKLLVTDYSSLCYDMLYMHKPVLFYQFDYERYMEKTGAYIDMEKNLPGERSFTINDLLSDIEKSAKSDFKLSYEYKLKREMSFTYFDKSNSSRIVQELRRLKF